MVKIKILRENIILFLFGGILYSLVEILFRGYTHWSMTVTGGLCLVILYRHFTHYTNESLLVKCFYGMFVITSLELAVGCIVNLMFKWNVWDYSGHMLNFMGQICLLFSFLWFLITIPVIWLCRFFSIKFAERRKVP